MDDLENLDQESDEFCSDSDDSSDESGPKFCVLSSQSQNSLISVSQSQSPSEHKKRFNLLPELDTIFVRKGYNANRTAKIECQLCKDFRATTNSYGRLVKHAKQCRFVEIGVKEVINKKFQEMMAIKEEGEDSDTKRRHLKLSSSFVQGNVQFRFVDCPHFIEFCHDLNPDYKLPDRHMISERYVPTISSNIERRFHDSVINMEDYSLSVEFDGWTDIIRRSLLGIIATKLDGSRYLFDLPDLSGQSHTANLLVAQIKQTISMIPPIKVNSLISDNASNCMSARQKLSMELEYIHVIQHRCMAHFMNNMGNDLAKREPFKTLVDSARSLANTLCIDSNFLKKLTDVGLKRVSTITETRWYSTVNMLESLTSVRKEALDYLESASKRDKRRQQVDIQLLKNDSFWAQVQKALGYIKPLVSVIATAERAIGSVGETVKDLLSYAAVILGGDWNDQFVMASVESFLTYFNEDKLGESEMNLLMACYVLDRRFKMDYITQNGRARALKSIIDIAQSSGFSSESIHTTLYKEFLEYTQQRGPLSKKAHRDTSAGEWWRAQSGTCLRLVGIRLANLKSSSANIERIFSLVRHIQGISRTRFTIDTLTALTRSKVGLSQRDLDEEQFDLMKSFQDLSLVEKPPTRRKTMSPRLEPRSLIADSVAIPQDDQTNDIYTREGKIAKLGPLGRYYEDFTQMIDFSIKNPLTERINCKASKTGAGVDVDSILKRFREDTDQLEDID